MTGPDAHPGPVTVAHAPGDESRLLAAMEEYWQAVQEGQTPDRQEFLDRYPDLADQLTACLDGLAFVQQAAPGLSEGGLPGVNDRVQSLGPGVPLGDYRLLREVGRGGMGVVYEAEQLSLSRRVALKVLPFASTLDPRQLQRFRNEAVAAASLAHPHIVAVHGVGCERGVHYFAMHFVEGQTLAQLVERLRTQLRQGDSAPVDSLSGVLARTPGPDATPASDPAEVTVDHTRPQPEQPQEGRSTRPADRGRTRPEGMLGAAYCRSVARLGMEVAEALDHAHQMGIVHRDVKPSNLMLDGHGKAWVTDFGLASMETGVGLTMTGDVLGTLRYMSPEQALAKHGLVDHRTDIYALGVTLYELLTLRPAIDGSSRQEILNRITLEEPDAPRTWNKAIPIDLETIVLKAMRSEPHHRYRTARECAEDLRRFVDDQPIAAKPPSFGQRLARWQRRHRPLVAALAGMAALALAALVVSTVLIWREKEATQEALGEAQYQQKQAERHFQQAREAADTYFTAISESTLLDEPGLQPLRKQLLQQAVRYYEKLVQARPDDPELQGDLAAAYLRLAGIAAYTGSEPDLLDNVARATAVVGRLLQEHPDATDAHRKVAGAWIGGRVQPGSPYAKAPDQRQSEQTLERAVQVWERLVERHPSVPGFRADLSKFYDRLWPYQSETEQLRSLERVVALREAVVRQEPGNPQHASELGWGYLRLAKYVRAQDRAEPLYQKTCEVVETLPHLSPYREQLAYAYASHAEFLLGKERPEEAAQAFQKAGAIYKRLVADYPHLPGYPIDFFKTQRGLIDAWKAAGRTDEAERSRRNALGTAKEWVALHPDNPKVLGDVAYSQFLLGEKDDAADTAQKALALDARNAQALVAMAWVERRRGHYQAALDLATRATNAEPGWFPAWEIRGQTHDLLGCYEDAARAYSQTLRIGPDAWWILKRRARVQFLLGRYDEALQDLTKAVEHNPTDFSSLTWIDPAQVARCPDEDFRKGLLQLADRAIELTDGSPKAHAARGHLRAALGNLDQARADFDKAVSSGKASHYAHYQQALFCLGTGDRAAYRKACQAMLARFADTEEATEAAFTAWTCVMAPGALPDYTPAVALAQRAVQQQPQDRHARTTLGAALYRAGQFEEALPHLTASTADDKETSPAYGWYLLAMAHHHLGHAAEARVWLDKAVARTQQELDSDASHQRRLTLNLLRSEAEALLGQSKQKSESRCPVPPSPGVND